MRKPRVIVTGAFGQDGSIFSQCLANQGYEVFGLVKNQNASSLSEYWRKLVSRGARIVSLSDSNKKSLSILVNEISPALIVHAAGVHGSSTNMPDVEKNLRDAMLFTHQTMTEVFLEYLEIRNATSGVFLSSSKVFNGLKQSGPVNLKTKPSPLGLYAESKLAMMELVAQSGLRGKAISAVLFPHTSSLSKKEFLAKSIIAQFQVQQKIKCPKIKLRNAFSEFDYSHALDSCLATLSALESGRVDRFIYGNGVTVSVKQVVEEIAFQMGIEDYEIVSKSSEREVCLWADLSDTNISLPKKQFPTLRSLIAEVLCLGNIGM